MLALDLCLHPRVAGGQLVELDEVARALRQVTPRRDLRAQRIGLAQDALGGAGVVPEVGLGGRLVEAAESLLLGG
jgi:hypothetical protein